MAETDLNISEEVNNTFKVINEHGEEIMCDILFTFDSEETKKSYIVYTDNSKDPQGNVQVFASIYDPNAESQKLEPITTEQEWKVIETILNTLQEEIKKKLDGVTDEDDEDGEDTEGDNE